MPPRYIAPVITGFAFIALTVPGLTALGAENPGDTVRWDIDTLSAVGGNATTMLGAPEVITTPGGKAVWFDGVDDGLQVGIHPLAGAERFTLEVIFRPDAGGPAEQRFFHLQENGTSNRLLLETRLLDGDMWALDTFLSSGDISQPLLDTTLVHPLGAWYNATLVFDGREMRHYINGVLELSAPVTGFVPHAAGKTSIGVRINEVYWFKGAIRTARFTRRALTPDEFLKP